MQAIKAIQFGLGTFTENPWSKSPVLRVHVSLAVYMYVSLGLDSAFTISGQLVLRLKSVRITALWL